MLNWDGVSKSSCKLEGDNVTHFWGWIKRPIAYSSVWKCLYADDTIEGESMMWMSFVMDINKQERTSSCKT